MTYEYLCGACRHEWETDQSITAAPLKECPRCHEQTARRQVSGGTGFVLKGGGWYADLYGSAPAKKDADVPSDGKSGDAAKGDAAKGDAAKGDAAKGESKEGDSRKGDGAAQDGAKSEAKQSKSKPKAKPEAGGAASGA